jgi:hypothetical protein
MSEDGEAVRRAVALGSDEFHSAHAKWTTGQN